MIETARLVYRNLLGKTTTRKIVVFESDDWGSVRIRSRKAYEEMKAAGVPVAEDHFTRYDCLESDDDLTALFEVLSRHKDSKGRNAVFTPLCTLVNPVFEKIKEAQYTQYYYESFVETCKRYEGHDGVCTLWKQGATEMLFVPQFHGREHINPLRWMRLLAAGDMNLNCMFEKQSYGCAAGIDINGVPSYLPAFDAEKPEDVPFILESIREGLDIFEKMMDYRASFFVPCSGTAVSEIESVLAEKGIRYINSGRMDMIPDGKGGYKKRINWLGKENELGQKYITRNCFFEPAGNDNVDWISKTLKEIEVAFLFHKPAIIGTHRVNYVGFIDERNRENGLGKLDQLISAILKRWPDVEFMTTPEMARLI